MKKALNIFFCCLITNITIWILVYAIACFLNWKFSNPFQWLIDMPNYGSQDRFLILFFLVSVWAIEIGFFKGLNNEIQTDKFYIQEKSTYPKGFNYIIMKRQLIFDIEVKEYIFLSDAEKAIEILKTMDKI